MNRVASQKAGKERYGLIMWTVREAFCAALEGPLETRDELLAQLPAEIRAEVVSLLAAHEAAGGFLSAPAEDTSPIHSRVGPYRLVEKLGEGGMGVVYRARRDDGEFEREVAIKFVGGRLFAPEAERRFIAERRILARLDHPNIARMIDGGIWQGRRFLVMELVLGESITQYALKPGVTLTRRLQLFQAICSAIHYAHQHLVIHRDLKPENILVTAEGQVKVLDFGIAQLIDDSDGEQSATFLHPMSLSCASPEQVRGDHLTLATDIYSLGVLLYELVAGRNPHGAGKPGEIRRRILEENHPAPVQGGAADLDAIVFKALAKEPTERYASAGEMSVDIDRFLEDRPVLARAPSRLYYAGRFCARNKALSATIVALLIAIIIGFATSAWEARRAEQQRTLAQRRFDDARRLIYTVVHEIQPKLASIDGTVSVRASLIEKTLTYLEALARDAQDNPALMRELVNAYVALAGVTGDGGVPSAGKPQRAAEILEKAGPLVATLLRTDVANADSLRTAVGFYRAESRYEAQYGDALKGQDYGRRALDAAERLTQAMPGDLNSQDIVAQAAVALADTYPSIGETIALYQQAISIWTRALEGNATEDTVTLRARLANASRNLSNAWLYKGDGKLALELAVRARALDQTSFDADPSSPAAKMNLAFDLGAMAAAYDELNDYEQAAAVQRRNIELRENVVAANPDDFRTTERLAYALNYLAHVEENQRDLAAARRDSLRAIALYEQLKRSGTLVHQSLEQYENARSRVARLDKNKSY